MRHLWSLLAGIVAAPLAWLCLATGQYRSSRTVANWNEESFFDTADLIGPAAFLVAAGIVLGLIGALRWSPAGALVAGLLFVTPTVLMFINPFETLDAFSVDQQRRLLGQDLQPWLPVENGTLLVLGTLLLVAIFSAQRWRRWPAGPAPLPAAADQPVVAGTATPTEGQPTSMSDEEILAAAAAMEEEEERAAATGEQPATSAEPPEPTEPPKPSTGPEPEPEPDNDESGTRSGTSSTS
jgi:hypothetical protein